jgi:hypothetical protein
MVYEIVLPTLSCETLPGGNHYQPSKTTVFSGPFHFQPPGSSVPFSCRHVGIKIWVSW